jgi:HEAT repeat protein
MASRLTRSDLIKALSEKPFWGPGDFSELQRKVGGAEALEDLIDLLQNQPDPAGQLDFGFRDTVVRLLGELGDARALVPLLRCYELYGALTDLLLRTLEDKGIAVPERFRSEVLVGLYRGAGSPPVRESTAYPAFQKRIAGSHIQSQLESSQIELRLLAFGWLVKVNVVRALAKIKVEGVNEVLANLLKQERETSARESVVLALGELQDPRAIEGLGAYLLEFTSASSYVTEEPKRVIDLLAAYPDERAKALLKQFWEKCTDGRKRDYRNQAAAHLGLPVKKSGCFLATAAYGSDALPQVLLLRTFRDTWLSQRRAGRAFVALYERVSPPLAGFICERPALRRLVRVVVLDHIVRLLQWMRAVEPSGGPPRDPVDASATATGGGCGATGGQGRSAR